MFKSMSLLNTVILPTGMKTLSPVRSSLTDSTAFLTVKSAPIAKPIGGSPAAEKNSNF